MKYEEDTLEYQLAHCDGKDCTCAAYGECECACGADWTPAEVYLLRDQVDALRKDAERYRWLVDSGNDTYAMFVEAETKAELDARIDAAMNGANA